MAVEDDMETREPAQNENIFMASLGQQGSNLGKSSEKMFSGAWMVYALQGKGRVCITSFFALFLCQRYLERMHRETRGALFMGGSHCITSLGKLEDGGSSRYVGFTTTVGDMGCMDSEK